MIEPNDPVGFATEWAEAWNQCDVERVLSHFHDDAVFKSPVAAQIGFAGDGVVTGKAELRRYWTAALEVNRDLHFDVTSVFRGVDTIVIAYKNQKGADRVEVLVFSKGLVVQGHGMFSVVSETGENPFARR